MWRVAQTLSALYELEKGENSASKWFWKAKGAERKKKRTHDEQQPCAGTAQGTEEP